MLQDAEDGKVRVLGLQSVVVEHAPEQILLSIVKLHLSAQPESAANREMTAMLDQAISEVRRISDTGARSTREYVST